MEKAREGRQGRQDLAVEMHAISSGNAGEKDDLAVAMRVNIEMVNPLQAGQNDEARHHSREGGRSVRGKKSPVCEWRQAANETGSAPLA